VGPENIDTPITEVHWKFRRGGWSQRPKSLKEGIQRGRGFKPKKPSGGGGMDIFWNNTIQLEKVFNFLRMKTALLFC